MSRRRIALFSVSRATVKRGRTLRLPFAATAAGTARLALRKGTKTLATATRTLADGGRGTFSLSGRRTRKLKPGSYGLQLTFTAPGADRPATDAIKLAVKR